MANNPVKLESENATMGLLKVLGGGFSGLLILYRYV